MSHPQGKDRPISHASFEEALQACHAALAAIITGDVRPWLKVYSPADDIIIGNPFGPFAVGRAAMTEVGSRAAGHYTDGKVHGFDRIGTFPSSDLAVVVEVEQFEVRLDHAPDLTQLAFRTTSVFRRERDGWRLVHRHADPINQVRSAEALKGK